MAPSDLTVDTLKQLLDERDRRYEERFTAMDKAVLAALAAQEKLTSAAFAASEKAIVKAEAAQVAHNDLANGLQDKLDESTKENIGRQEFDQRFGGLEDKVTDLQQTRSKLGGRDEALEQARANQKWIIGLGITLALFIAGALMQRYLQ